MLRSMFIAHKRREAKLISCKGRALQSGVQPEVPHAASEQMLTSDTNVSAPTGVSRNILRKLASRDA